MTVDWTAGPMRFQADRSFERPDGTLQQLAVTQIGTAGLKVVYTVPIESNLTTAK